MFLLAVPVMALLLAVGPRLLPEFRDPGAGRLDLLSAGQSLVAVLAVIYGVKRIAEDGLRPPAAASILVGLAVGRSSSGGNGGWTTPSSTSGSSGCRPSAPRSG